MKTLLLVYASQTGNTRALVSAFAEGVVDSKEPLCLRVLPALQAGAADLLAADALVLATPENFGYMAGAVKDFLDRSYYPAQGRTNGLPYALLVSAGNDGHGAVQSLGRIATGFAWREVASPIIMRDGIQPDSLAQARALGASFATALVLGIW